MVRWVRAALCALALALPAAAPSAAEFPARPIRLVVPYPAGGSNDVIARILAQRLSEVWKQTVVVDNRAGAGGNIGAELVARAPPDGYTLLLTAPAPLTINPTLFAKLGYDPRKDFVPIALVASVPIVLIVNTGVKAASVAELVALAKAEPGRLNFGSSGAGSTNHLAGELLKSLAGIDAVHVPYRGAAPAMNDLVGGQITFLFDNMPAVKPQVDDGRVRALAVAGSARSPLLPGLPTMAEAGVAGFEASAWFGLVAPAATPPDVVTVIAGAVERVLKEPAIVERFGALGAQPGTLHGPAFGDYLARETDKWAGIIKTAGIPPL